MSEKMNRKIRKALILGAVAGAVTGILITFAAANKAVGKKETTMAAREKKLEAENKELKSKVKQQKTVEAAVNLSTQKAENWELVLVNYDYPLDPKYKPELADVAPDRAVDARIAEDAKKMLADASEAGLNMHIISGYRSYDDQKNVFNETMQQHVNAGKSYIDAYNETKKSVAVPGYSEHSLGMALDIVSKEHQELDDSQADTKESKWLAANSYKYGFILRYPLDKSNITGIVFEPWHYRYVGKDAAKDIVDKGVTMEEYCGVN